MNPNKFAAMDLSSKIRPKRASEPVDEWLQKEGFYRKNIPKDPTCLFRAIAEQVYHHQRNHYKVRQECIEYMRENKQLFSEKTTIPVGTYCDQMACLTEWGGTNEILAMSLLYKRNVVIFDGINLTRNVALDHGYQECFYLCFMPPKQYETVYNKEHMATAGFCQSIIYQMLYKNIFKMSNIDAIVNKMLHEGHLKHDKFFNKKNLPNKDQLTVELLSKLKEIEDSEELQLLDKGITPFPYRVAKALDPNVYRNVEYDIWLEIRREKRYSGFTKHNALELRIGAKCLVQLDFENSDKINNNIPTSNIYSNNLKDLVEPINLETLFYTGHIQEITKNQGSVVVFIEELGQKVIVPFKNLRPYPQRKFKPNQNWALPYNKRNAITQNPKWKKSWTGPNRRIKDQVTNDGNKDKNQNNNLKNVTKNVMNKPEEIHNQQVKMPSESYVTLKDCNDNIDSLKTSLENTHLSVGTAEKTINDNNNKSSTNNDLNENLSKKQITSSCNNEPNFQNKQNHKRFEKIDVFYPAHQVNYNETSTNNGQYENLPKKQINLSSNNDPNVLNKQNHQRVEKIDMFYPHYPGNIFPPIPRFPVNLDVVHYDTTKNYEVKGNEASTDPAAVPHFYNSGVKYYWSQNPWPNGTNGQTPNDNVFIMVHPTDHNGHPIMMNAAVPIGESAQFHKYPNNANVRPNNRVSPSRYQDHNANSPRPTSQRINNRNPDYRNVAYNPQNIDYKNRNDVKNAITNELPQQNGNKDMQRGNKSNVMAPRFKRNYEGGKYRNDHHNVQNQYRQSYQPEFDMRKKKEMNFPMIPPNRYDTMTDPAQHHQPQQPLGPILHQTQPPPPHLAQQQLPIIQSQTPPPLNGPYPYTAPYTQMSFVPAGPYPPEPETFPGSYYQPGYVPVSYVSSSELTEQPVYHPAENFSNQYQPIYPQYVYPPPATIYPNQPPPPDGCYQVSSFPGQPYLLPYPAPLPPPGLQPASLAAPPASQNTQ